MKCTEAKRSEAGAAPASCVLLRRRSPPWSTFLPASATPRLGTPADLTYIHQSPLWTYCILCHWTPRLNLLTAAYILGFGPLSAASSTEAEQPDREADQPYRQTETQVQVEADHALNHLCRMLPPVLSSPPQYGCDLASFLLSFLASAPCAFPPRIGPYLLPSAVSRSIISS